MVLDTLHSLPRSSETIRSFRNDPLGFLVDVANNGLSSSEIHLGRRRIVLLKDAGHIEELLVKKQVFFKKGPGLLRLRPVLGDGLLTIDDAGHQDRRRLLQSAFSLPKIAEYGGALESIVAGQIEEWKPGEMREILSEMARIALAIVVSTLFGSSVTPDHRAVSDAITRNIDALYRPLLHCPHSEGRVKPSRASFVKVLDSIAVNHSERLGDDNLWSLLASSGLSDAVIEDEALTFLLGGHESVSVALCWSWFALSQNPDVLRRFEAEIDAVEAYCLRPERLPFTRQIVAETLRLYPPAWLFSREATADVTIGGNDYAKGSVLVVSPYVTQRDWTYWDSPTEFDPDRWDPSQQTLSATPRFSYFPFGGGARRCIGEQFALTELPIVLATIGKKWRLVREPGALDPEFDPVVTLRPKGGLGMVLQPR